MLAIICSLFSKYMSFAKINEIIESMPLLITAIVGFVSSIISIPVAITKYLFSTKEDENITQIILHTQDHDTNGRQWALEFRRKAEELNNKERLNHAGGRDVDNGAA